MIPQKDLLKLTGYIRGGCSPFGMKKLYPTFVDISAFLHVKILVSAGVRGTQLEIAPKVLSDILGTKSGKLIH
jgi:Cys-tRNA(Pro)/Cys-tRNA(Cys) deacylase